MRIGAIPDSLVERLGLLLGKVPTPIGEAMFSMPVARSLQVAQRTGILGALAEGPRDPAELAEHLGLQATGTMPRPRRDRHRSATSSRTRTGATR